MYIPTAIDAYSSKQSLYFVEFIITIISNFLSQMRIRSNTLTWTVRRRT